MNVRRITTVVVAVAAATLLSPVGSASAAAPSPRPQVTIGDLTAAPGPEGGTEWWLAVDAVDPDGVIWEVTVRWSDRTVTWASTMCVQGTDAGLPAHLLIPHTFAAPGRYVAQVEATSMQACPWVAPGGTSQDSRLVAKTFTIPG